MILPKKIGSFFKLPIQLFYGVPYPELALRESEMSTLNEFHELHPITGVEAVAAATVRAAASVSGVRMMMWGQCG